MLTGSNFTRNISIFTTIQNNKLKQIDTNGEKKYGVKNFFNANNKNKTLLTKLSSFLEVSNGYLFRFIPVKFRIVKFGNWIFPIRLTTL